MPKRPIIHYALFPLTTFCGLGEGVATSKDWERVTCKRCIAGSKRWSK